MLHEEVVLEAHEEARLARVSLPPRAAAKLVVNAARLVPVGPEDEEAAEPAMFVEIVTAPTSPASAMTADVTPSLGSPRGPLEGELRETNPGD